MTLFQWIGLGTIVLVLLITAVAIGRRRVSLGVGLGWALIWVAAGAAISRPGLTVVVARALGIGRGADLILYCSILAMGVGFFMMYVRYRKVEEEITRLVRHIALLEGESGRRNDE